MKEGDKNTSFFHRFASHNHAQSNILSLKYINGRTLSSFQYLSLEAKNHFRSSFKAGEGCNLGDAMKVVRLFLTIFSVEDNLSIDALVSLEELKSMLSGF